MSIRMGNFLGNNDNLRVVDEQGIFTVFEYVEYLSVSVGTAERCYYMAQMGVVPKQVLIKLSKNAIRLKPGAMQMMFGNIQQETGVKGVGDLASKFIKGKMTGDNAIKPLYKGSGYIITEPTYAFPIIVNTADFGGAIVCDDGMFYCCDDELKDSVVMRDNLSSVAGGEGLFNLCLEGDGLAVVCSACPYEELYVLDLDNDIVKIDGNNAVCWSKSLQFTVERSGKSIIGSMASGEGLVNVYRGTGRILVAPLNGGGLTASGTRHTTQSVNKSQLMGNAISGLLSN